MNNLAFHYQQKHSRFRHCNKNINFLMNRPIKINFFTSP